MSPPRASSALAELSAQLAAAVENAGNSVVAIHARRRIPSSGVVWRDGVIVSASHTVRRDEGISVTLASGESVAATIAGRDPATDLIALRVNGAAARVAPRADTSAARPGSLVLAVGRPGRSATATFGIVSAVVEGWRSSQGARLDGALRLDLAIQDGFSGGALVAASGGLVGITNSALARGTPIGLPAATVDRVVEELLTRGHVRRPYLGVAVHPVALGGSLAKKHQPRQATGLIVMSVAEGGPAETAGILVGDILLDVQGQSLQRTSDLLDALSGASGDSAIKLTFLRGGAILSLSVVPVDRDDPSRGGVE